MQQVNTVGVYADGTGNYGIWVQAQIDIGGRAVPVDVKGEPVFDDIEVANDRARDVFNSMTGRGFWTVQFLPLDFHEPFDDDEEEDEPYIHRPGDLRDELLQAERLADAVGGEDAHLEAAYEDRVSGLSDMYDPELD